MGRWIWITLIILTMAAVAVACGVDEGDKESADDDDEGTTSDTSCEDAAAFLLMPDCLTIQNDEGELLTVEELCARDDADCFVDCYDNAPGDATCADMGECIQNNCIIGALGDDDDDDTSADDDTSSDDDDDDTAGDDDTA
ncbi:hypothetical protein KDL45_02735 [bacterium]|nr:hypothetical protein [bacterium]